MNEARITAEEIDKLKLNWHDDPVWDIEDTEGFEAHREELRAYRLALEAKDYAAEDRDRRLNFSRQILPHVVAIAAGLCANPAMNRVGPVFIATLAIDQVQEIYAELNLGWPGLPQEEEESPGLP